MGPFCWLWLAIAVLSAGQHLRLDARFDCLLLYCSFQRQGKLHAGSQWSRLTARRCHGSGPVDCFSSFPTATVLPRPSSLGSHFSRSIVLEPRSVGECNKTRTFAWFGSQGSPSRSKTLPLRPLRVPWVNPARTEPSQQGLVPIIRFPAVGCSSASQKHICTPTGRASLK